MRYWDEIPIDDIIFGANQFFQKTPAFISVSFNDEYNDEYNVLRATEIKALDEHHDEIPLAFDEDDYKDKRSDEYNDWRYSLRIGGESGGDEDRSLGEILINVKTKEIVSDMPELFVKE